jgi:hypothetical protein
MPIKNDALRTLTTQILAQHRSDPKASVDGDELLAILLNIGSRGHKGEQGLKRILNNSRVSIEDKLEQVRGQMTDGGKDDLEALLRNTHIPLHPDVRTILKSLLPKSRTDENTLKDAWERLPFDAPRDASNLRPVGRQSPSQQGSLLRLQMDELKAAPQAQSVAKKVADGLLKEVQSFTGLQGNGLEQFGRGDPNLLRRRELLSQLLDQDVLQLDSLQGAWLNTDNDLLSRLDRTDTPNLDVGRYDALWKSLKDSVEGVEKSNRADALKSVEALSKGEIDFIGVDPQTFSTEVLNHIDDPKARSQAMIDMLLQFREPQDTSTSRKKMLAGGAGLQAVFELRDTVKTISASGDTPQADQDYALMRALTIANPRNSGNAVLSARHIVSNIRRMSWQMVYGPDAEVSDTKTSPYTAIHHNFSIESPKIIRTFVGDKVFGGGDPETFCTLVDAMTLHGKEGGASQAQDQLKTLLDKDPLFKKDWEAFAASPEAKDKNFSQQIETFLVGRCQAPLDSTDTNDPTLSSAQRRHLSNGNVSSVKGEYAEKFNLCARLYRAVCNAMPNKTVLGEKMFSGALDQWPKIADVITHLDMQASPVATLSSISKARKAIRQSFDARGDGFRRLDAWELDQKLELLSSSLLGKVIDDVGSLEKDPQKSQALGAMEFALEGAITSGLDSIYDLDDPIATKPPTLKDALADVQALTKAGQCDLADYRQAMGTAYEAIVKCTENVRTIVERRVPYVSEGTLIPNPTFMDDFVKEGPLHYARALAQKALSVGLSQEISPQRVINPDGVSVLNNLGRCVFDRILIADTMADLKELGAGRDDFCIVRTMDEKKMAAVGGIMSDFPGGYCHAAVYARGAGMAALSSSDIGANWSAFVKNAAGDKMYYDDSAGKLVMMPLKEAIKRGVVRNDEVSKLKPGSNRKVDYLSWSEAEKEWKTIGSHEVVVHPDRPTHHIQIYTPADTVNGLGQECVSFEDAGALGVNGRGLGGEKNTVLAMMSVDETLKDMVPPGSYIPTSRCFKVLEDSGILKAWREPYDKDPIVGRITDDNFLKSKFYTDTAYRKNVRTELRALVQKKVNQGLLGADGKPTAVGAQLLKEMRANPAMAGCSNWIMRSSYTAEDRPYKSGAGQYDSVPNCRTDKEILEGVVTVLAAAWDEPPIENNVVEEYNLMHIQPAITAMKCLNAQYSGVMISRDSDTGHRRTVSYQLVRGFGGGVEHGVTEEGRVSQGDHAIKRHLPNMQKTLMGEDIPQQLWKSGLDIERLFHQKIEPGQGFAVDVEWVFDKDDQKLYIVQARTVRT